MTSIENINKVFDLYVNYGSNGYIGEKLSQLEHAAQAGMLAEKEGCSDEIILGAFLHDIGHLLIYVNPGMETMNNYGVMNHELIGANYLQDMGFDEIICKLVSGHILTKRYLLTKHPEYYNKLSDASKHTFEFQGGLLSNDEILQFENNPLYIMNLKIREWDDKAKDASFKMKMYIDSINPIEYFKNIAIRHFLKKGVC